MNVTRREILGTVPAAMAGAWALAGHGQSAWAQGASYVPAKLGVQLYTVRDQLKTLDATLGAIKAAGFDEVETLRPIMADLPPLLKKHGLTAPSGHFDAGLILDVGEIGKKGLGAYTFDRHRLEKERFFKEKLSLEIVVHPDHQADAEARKARYAWVSENVNLARDLINEPANIVTPVVLAERAQQIALEGGLQCEVLDETALKAGQHHGSTYYQHQHFNAVVRGEGDVLVTAQDGLRAVEIGAAAELSAREKRVVTLDEVRA